MNPRHLPWLLTLGLLSALPAAAATPPSVSFAPESRIWLTGESTLHPFSSTASHWKLAVALAPQAAVPPAHKLADWLERGRVSSLQVIIPAAGLKSGDGMLDHNMYVALESDRHPTIRFTMTRGTVHKSADGAIDADLSGMLAIAGVERPTVVHATGKLSGETFHLVGQKAVSMSAYGVKPPSLLLGAIKVADRIVVHFDLTGQLKP